MWKSISRRSIWHIICVGTLSTGHFTRQKRFPLTHALLRYMCLSPFFATSQNSILILPFKPPHRRICWANSTAHMGHPKGVKNDKMLETSFESLAATFISVVIFNSYGHKKLHDKVWHCTHYPKWVIIGISEFFGCFLPSESNNIDEIGQIW